MAFFVLGQVWMTHLLTGWSIAGNVWEALARPSRGSRDGLRLWENLEGWPAAVEDCCWSFSSGSIAFTWRTFASARASFRASSKS